MDDATRKAIIAQLIEERNKRKFGDIMRVFQESGDDWNQTMHTMLLKFIGGFDNAAAAMKLAKRVPYAIIMRERSSKMAIEALLLGTSGLLELYDHDDEYVMRLREEYCHLCAKYNLTAMDCREWRTSNVRTQNHPTLRLAQLAACYMDSDISMNSITQCRRLADIYKLFSGKASEYWLKHFIPFTIIEDTSASFGKMKCELLGINFVVQMMYAYGCYTHSATLCTQAMELLRSIPAERNRYTEMWNSPTTIATNASDSQALIQLSREYCSRKRCVSCPVNLYAHAECNISPSHTDK
jgi:hypothetical protein